MPTKKLNKEKNEKENDSAIDFIFKCRQYLVDKISGYISEDQFRECLSLADMEKIKNPSELLKDVLKKEEIKVLKSNSFEDMTNKDIENLISFLSSYNWQKALSIPKTPKDNLKVSKIVEKLKKTADSSEKLTFVQSYFNQVSQHKLLTAQEEKELSDLSKAGNEEATNKLVLSNLRLVISIAKRYQNRGLPLIDLVQEGNIGLLKAVQKFNADKGNKFSTYAHWWIQQAITRALADKGSVIRVPVHLYEMRNKIVRFYRSFAVDNNGAVPTIDQIHEGTGISKKKIAYVISIQNVSVMLDSASSASMSDIATESNSEDIFNDTLNTKTSSLIKELVSSLPARESEVLKMRFGDDESLSSKANTLDNIGKKLGVTRERVRQIQNRALSRLKQRVRKKLMEGS